MPYPFAPMPTLGEFIAKSEASYGAILRHSRNEIEGPDGLFKARYLIRIHNGDQYHSVLPPNIGDDDVLTPHVLRRLCSRLDVPSSDYGLTLTDNGWEPTDIDEGGQG